MIPLLVILLTIHGVIGMHGEPSSDVNFAEFVVSIWYFHEHRCSGSILDRTHILTTGNCVNSLPISLLSIAAGIIKFHPRDFQLAPVKSIHLHPGFHIDCLAKGTHWKNNIAILELSEELIWASTIAAVPLIDREYNWDPCVFYDLFGWNDATVDGVKLLTLRWSQMIVMQEEECRNLDVSLSENEQCLENRFQTTVLEDVRKIIIVRVTYPGCVRQEPDSGSYESLIQGDHGAPLISGGSAVGIVVGGGENRENPPIVLSIYPYLGFIADILNVHDFNVPGRMQHYVAILHDGFYRCGGSIIDSRHILTAAHCIEDAGSNTLTILPGHSEVLTRRINSIEFSLVDRIQIHPRYVRVPFGNDVKSIVMNDVAVLTLQEPLVWSDTINAIGLADDLPVGETCRAYRWSRTTTRDGGKSLKSLWSSARIHDPDTCRKINPLLQSNKFCVVNTYSLPITTHGDSGSPIVCDGPFLVGILSSHSLSQRLAWGPFQAMYYTTIFPYRKFISDAVADRIL